MHHLATQLLSLVNAPNPKAFALTKGKKRRRPASQRRFPGDLNSPTPFVVAFRGFLLTARSRHWSQQEADAQRQR